MKIHRLIAIFGILALFAAGCGDDGKETGASKPQPTASKNGTDAAVTPEDEAPAKIDPKDTGNIVGAVTFKGDVPQNLKIEMKSDAYCAGAHKDDVFAEEVIVKDGKLANVLVHIKTGIKGKFEPPAEAATIDQNGCAYKPHVVALMVGQKLVIRNSDDTSHNIHFLPKINPEDNFSQAKKDMTADRSFKSPEIGAKIKCDVHPWMAAHLHVLRHPFFKVTGSDGAFKIEGVPAGEYTLAAWHEKYGEKTAKVTVAAGKDATANFEFEHK